jgi:hypothetical protein
MTNSDFKVSILEKEVVVVHVGAYLSLPDPFERHRQHAGIPARRRVSVRLS